ncbi:unnamed protein product [Echinostoma caproni]|uniref:L51_S25_CI-B8 domain-containing protein n=1 Tax=Echinostoma caproni TaxID=27848 RepID=A0A183BF06_9TREM|nr:unnamed protein product [Echinostoma caproni]
MDVHSCRCSHWNTDYRILQYYELLVDLRKLQLINPTSNVKFTGLKAGPNVYRLTGLKPDIPDIQTLIARFPMLTKPVEDLTLAAARVAHYIVTKDAPVTATCGTLAPCLNFQSACDRKYFYSANCEISIDI